MSLHAVIAPQAIFWSMAAKIALCDQIRRIRREKSYGSLSVAFFIVGTASYAWQVTDGMTGGGWDQVWEQGLGVILGLIIGCQICWYRWAGKLGWRTDSRGHYPAMRDCRACIDGFPVACRWCRRGLMHGEPAKSKFARREISLHCDKCTMNVVRSPENEILKPFF